MAKITNEQTKNIVRTNRILVDGQIVKTQQYTINSETPDSLNPTSYFVGVEGEKLYKENRAAIRALENSFEDEVFAEQDQLIGGNTNESK